MAIELFTAYSEIEDIQWFVDNRLQPLHLPYEDLITDYWMIDEGSRVYSEFYLQESFTAEEIKQLEDYLKTLGTRIEVKKVQFPIPNNFMPYGGVPAGGQNDFCLLTEQPDYDLPFEVWGLVSREDTLHTFFPE